MRKLLVTGSSGLIGSEVCTYFSELGWAVEGADNNGRAAFFGEKGDTRWNQHRLQASLSNFEHHEVDVRDRDQIDQLVREVRPDAVVHAAAQPSHDLAARIPFADFDVNAGGTMNLLEAVRRSAPDAVFVHLSTNKVYGDAPNELPLTEEASRWEYAREEDSAGITEEMRIDRSKHSLFGASKVAADVMVQEYGRYFGLRTTCLRGGCLTGPNHAGVELHGFLSYLVTCNVTGTPYRIFGYKGKQVRDNIHARDVSRFIQRVIEDPTPGEVYNLGGGRENSCSILEAGEMATAVSGRRTEFVYDEQNREGDHMCYITDLTKAKRDYPGWSVETTLETIFEELYAGLLERV